MEMIHFSIDETQIIRLLQKTIEGDPKWEEFDFPITGLVSITKTVPYRSFVRFFVKFENEEGIVLAEMLMDAGAFRGEKEIDIELWITQMSYVD